MDVLNLKESKNSLISKVNFIKKKSSISKERCDVLINRIKTELNCFERYNYFEEQIDELDKDLENILDDYDPFEDSDMFIYSDDEDSETSEVEELEWWEIEDKTEKKQTIRFSLPDILEIVDFEPFESMKRITKRLDLNNRIRKQRITKQITDDLRDRLINFLNFCDDYMDRIKWLEMKENILKREKSELYDDFICNRINQQLNECCSDNDYDILKDIDDIDSLERLSEINKKVDELQHSNIIKIAILYRIKLSCTDIINEIEDLYDLIITSEMNYYRINLLKILLDETI